MRELSRQEWIVSIESLGLKFSMRRMNIQIWFAFTVIFLLLELVQLPEARKYMRPWKFHGSASRWHAFSRVPRNRFKRKPPKFRRPKWYSSRHASHYVADDEPYTIEIELPKKRGRMGRHHSKIWDTRHREYDDSDDDYQESDLISEKKGMRVKWIKGDNPKLRIQISRNDDLSVLGVTEMRDATAVDATYRPENASHQAVTMADRINESTESHTRDFSGI